MTELDPQTADGPPQPPPSATDPIDARLAEVIAPFAAPIAGSEPSGENARHDERHAAIRNEIEKLGRPQGEPVDWKLVRDHGRALLTEKSKDFLIAAYFTVGAYSTDGVSGLVQGLSAMNALLEHHWDTGFPPVRRIRARVNAIDWCVERLGLLQEQVESRATRSELQTLSRAAKSLEQRVLDRFEDEAPNIYGLRDTIDRIERSVVTEAEAEPPPAPEAPPATGGSASSDGAPSPGPNPHVASSDTATAGDSVTSRFEELVRPFSAPIPGSAAAGENARYDDAHQAIRNEVEKLGSPTGGEVDWGLLRDSGRTLLTTRSKDFQIASYYTIGAFHTAGVPGLVSGIAALTALLQRYWDDGFPPPKRLRARVNAIDWFVDRAGAVVEASPPSHVSPDDIALLNTAANTLERLVLDRFGDEPPNIFAFKETLQRIERAVAPQAPAAAAEPVAASTPAAATARVELEAPTAALADPAEVQKFLREVGASLHKASRELFKVSKEDPLAYRLCRQGLYIAILQAPVATEGNATTLPAPPSDREQAFNAMAGAQNWAALLDEAESSLLGTRFWLDLHRYVAVALGGLGFDAAREVVETETVGLVTRLPTLVDLAFDDGRPFASQATRDWLSTLAPSSSGASRSAETDGADGEAGAFEQSLAEGHALALGGKLDDAMTKLREVAETQATSGRERFRARLAMADACSACGAPALAEGILAGLCEEIERLGLQEWEPKLTERCYRSRYEALVAMAGNSANTRDQLMEIYRRLCSVAPAAALELGKPPV